MEQECTCARADEFLRAMTGSMRRVKRMTALGQRMDLSQKSFSSLILCSSRPIRGRNAGTTAPLAGQASADLSTMLQALPDNKNYNIAIEAQLLHIE